MPTRRTFLGQAVALAAGGLVTTGAAAGQTTDTQYATTTASFALDGRILGVTGIPATVAPQVTTLTEWYDSVSLADIQTLSGRVRFSGTAVSQGHIIASGSFDVDGLTSELGEHEPRFSIVSGQDSAAQHLTAPGSDSPQTARFVDRGAGEIIDVNATRLGVSRGQIGAESLQSQPVGTLASTGQPASDDLAAVLDGHAVGVGTIAPSAKQSLRRRLSDVPDTFHTVLRGLRGGGFGIRVGRSETQLRYGLAVDSSVTETDFEALVSEFEAVSDVSVTDMVYEGTRLVVDGTVPTASLWDTHEQFLGVR